MKHKFEFTATNQNTPSHTQNYYIHNDLQCILMTGPSDNTVICTNNSDPTLFLPSLCIPNGQRAHTFFMAKVMVFFWEFLWLRSNIIQFKAISFASDPYYVANWNVSHGSLQRDPTASSLNSKSNEVMNHGFRILKDMEDSFRKFPRVILESVKSPSDYPQESLSKRFNAMYNNSNGEVAIREEANRERWSTQIN